MGGLFFGGRSTTTRAEMLTELQINQASYGETVPVILGTTRVSGNIIDFIDFTAHEHKESHRVGKGGGSKMTNITYTYTVAAALALCEGPVQGLGRVWINKDVYTYPSSEIPFNLFKGTAGQAPWQYMQDKHPERALPYSGLAYVAGVVDLGASSSLPQYSFEVKGLLLDTGDGVDVNPADYILYILTDPTNGAGFSLSDIDMDSLNRAREYWAAADLLISTPRGGKAKKAHEIINNICELTGVYCFWSQNKLKFVPACLDDLEHGGHVYEANRTILYDLTPSELLEQSGGGSVTFERRETSQAFNIATVEFTNRANAYETESVKYEVTSDILRHGVRPGPKVQAEYIYTKARALFLAERLAKQYIYNRNVYRFSLDWAYSALEPGDLVTLTDPATGLDRKVVAIEKVKEDPDGAVHIEAVAVQEGAYTPARYSGDEPPRAYLDRNVEPSPVDNVTIFQPPGAITQNGLEVWLGFSAGPHFGGARLYVSDDNEKYKHAANVERRARLGALVEGIDEGATSLVVSMVHGELLSGTAQDAERGNTLLWIDGELLSYETAQLIAANTYKLGGLIRGQYGTTAKGAAAGARVVRLDEAIYKQPFRREDIGKTVFIKLAAVNEFDNMEQPLEEVRAYSYTLKPYHVPQVKKLAARPKFRAGKSGGYDLIVETEPPTLDGYDTTAIYYQEEGGPWLFAGYTRDTLTINQVTTGARYTIRAQVKDTHGAISDEVTAPTVSVEARSRAEVPNTPEGAALAFGTDVVLSWREVVNTDIEAYEVRSDDLAGASAGLIARVTGTSVIVNLTARAGRLYVFAKHPTGTYSTPAIVEYNKPAPPAPKGLRVKSIIGGLAITCQTLPPGTRGVAFYVDGERYTATGNAFTYYGDAGVKAVTAAFFDTLGEGDKTPEVLGSISATIPPEYLEGLKVKAGQLDAEIQKRLDAGATAAAGVDSIVQALNGDGREYSAIAQLSDGLALKVGRDDVVSAINLAPEGVKIDGRLVHITGQTVIDKDVTIKAHLDANSVTADKLKVDSLASITANIGTLRTATSGARTEISDNLIQVFDDAGRLRVRIGVWNEGGN